MADKLPFKMEVDQNICIPLVAKSDEDLQLYQQACERVNKMLSSYKQDSSAFAKMGRDKQLALVAFNFACQTIKKNTNAESADSRISQMVKDLDIFLKSNK